MHRRIAEGLIVEGGTPNTSEWIEMAGTNSARFEVKCYNSSGSSAMTVHVEQSNDGCNAEPYDDGSGAVTFSVAQGIGLTSEEIRQTSARFLRLRYAASGSDKFIVDVDVYTADTGSS